MISRMSREIQSGSDIVGTEGGEVAVIGEGDWPMKEFEFLRMPFRGLISFVCCSCWRGLNIPFGRACMSS
jgi:hypothetical protein